MRTENYVVKITVYVENNFIIVSSVARQKVAGAELPTESQINTSILGCNHGAELPIFRKNTPQPMLSGDNITQVRSEHTSLSKVCCLTKKEAEQWIRNIHKKLLQLEKHRENLEEAVKDLRIYCN